MRLVGFEKLRKKRLQWDLNLWHILAKRITKTRLIWYNNVMNELMKRIADHLGLDPIPVKYEDIPDDSRMYFEKG